MAPARILPREPQHQLPNLPRQARPSARAGRLSPLPANKPVGKPRSTVTARVALDVRTRTTKPEADRSSATASSGGRLPPLAHVATVARSSRRDRHVQLPDASSLNRRHALLDLMVSASATIWPGTPPGLAALGQR